ncbi:redoxin domain-containing protein [Halolamina sp.]|jgi:peroxiredoxin|uniref:redoxin domain-containing protein n=1 Tax=Halolamina sp. TaxID=1940283 RepID=UPI000223BDE7|nr:alkyl hydroperoxide reductase/ Thiol specific antioxidant/ Mal allergen [halophilic archaeon DL31]
MDLSFEVVDLPDADPLAEGDTAPDFTRPLVNGEYWEDRSFSSLTDDGKVLLVAFPMDGAFPATYIWNEIRDRGWGGDDLTVAGVSISSPYEHESFIEEREMEYDLFSDPDAGVAEAYGIENELDGMTGVTEHRPAVFLVDEDRTVEYAWAATEWPDFPEYDEIEAALE